MKTRMIHIRITDDVCNSIASRAERLGVSVSAYVRMLVHAIPTGTLDAGIDKHFSTCGSTRTEVTNCIKKYQ